MSDTGRTSLFSMNENLMALLEAVLTLAASDAVALRRPIRPAIKPGGYSEDIFLDLAEDEQEELSCNICYQVLKEAMRCMNHHKFCHSCLYVWSTTGQYANRIRCPVCRCQGFYVRDDDIDNRINKKRVKCSQESCKWMGPLSLLETHRHTMYGGTSRMTGRAQLRKNSDDDEEDEAEEEEEERSSVIELPYLGRATPRVPHRAQLRFSTTGLTGRSTTAAEGSFATSSESRAEPTVQTAAQLDSTSSPAVPRIIGSLSREPMRTAAAGTNTEDPSPGGLTIRQRLYPIRRNPVSRITITHTDRNNNVAAASSTMAGRETPQLTRPSSPDRAPPTPRQPRPPSSPRPTSMLPRRSLGLSVMQQPTRPPSGSQSSLSPPTDHMIRAPPTFNAVAASRARGQSALNAFHSRLQESRDRLQALVTSYSGEVDRSRQEAAEVATAVADQQRDHVSEVRDLGHRLGQVASDLRGLLNQRRVRPPSRSDD